jgi:hypothetical protein
MPTSSTLELKDWTGTVTFFRSKVLTLPSAEHAGLPFSQLVESVASDDGPCLVDSKDRVPYYVPCLLKVAPYVCETAVKMARRGLTHGKQRSKSHVTTATWVIFDMDGIDEAAMLAALERLRRDRVSHIAYTSWSYGAPDKPGFRGRVLVPVDRTLDGDEYTSAWRWANSHYFSGLADISSRHMYQQQGLWACPPERRKLARRWVHRAGVLAVGDVLRSIPPRPAMQRATVATVTPPAEMRVQVDAARACVMTAPLNDLLAVVGAPVLVRDGEGREGAVLTLAGRLHSAGLPADFVESVCEQFNAARVVPPLDTDVVADRASRHAGRPVMWPVLFKLARDVAAKVVGHAEAVDDWSMVNESVWGYLCTYHPATWQKVYRSREKA